MSATTITPSPTLLPDPTDESAGPITPGRADDLIASLADQQIDDMMSEADGGARDEDADEAVDAAINAASQMGDVATEMVESAAGELRAELDQLEAERTTIEPAKAEVAVESKTTIEAAPDIEAAPEPQPTPEPSTEPAVASSPSFNPPAHAKIETPAADDIDLEASFETPDMEASGADEVARELAADVALLSTPLPSVVEHDAEAKARDPWWRRMLAIIVSVPMLILGAINLPVRPLSDRGREIIGGIGIVTLVNAAGLLIYLTMFAHRHS